jgi:hypothetical protein
MKTEIVTLAGVDVELRQPTSVAARWDAYGAVAQNPARGFAAALGLCWAGPNRPKPRYAAHKYDPLSYGGAVLDDLASRGISIAEINGAGLVAWKLCGDGLLSAQEVAEAEDFSSGEEG